MMHDSVTVRHGGGEDGISETTIENPEFVHVLLNMNQVAIDGTTYSQVQEVEYNSHD